MMATEQLLIDGKLPEARALFGVIAYDPHAGKMRESRLKVMEAIVAGKGADPLKLLRENDETDEDGKAAGRKKLSAP